MTSPTSVTVMDRPQLSLLDRAATLSAWALGIALFATVGWHALAPDDPLAPVTFFGRRGALIALLEVVAMATVAAGLATLIAGRKLADIGAFSVALGLACASLRGGTSAWLLLERADGGGGTNAALALFFAFDTLAWLVVVAVSLLAGAAVLRWFYGLPDPSRADEMDVRTMAFSGVAGYDVPGVSMRLFGGLPGPQTRLADGIRHTLIASGVGLIVLALVSTGLSFRSIQHGQVCFVVAVSVFIGVDVAYRLMPVRSALWAILAVGIMAVAGYVWSAFRAAPPGLPPNVPATHFMRVLPVQFVSVGTAAALVAFWYAYLPAPTVEVDRSSHR